MRGMRTTLGLGLGWSAYPWTLFIPFFFLFLSLLSWDLDPNSTELSGKARLVQKLTYILNHNSDPNLDPNPNPNRENYGLCPTKAV